mgnify:CR=1 FL=1
MDILQRVWGTVLNGARKVGSLLSVPVLALWDEVVDGASRLSWWLLLALVWLDGVVASWWLWVR